MGTRLSRKGHATSRRRAKRGAARSTERWRGSLRTSQYHMQYRLIVEQPRLTKETAVMTTQSFIWALALISSLNLSGCTDARLDQSIALCTKAIELDASQLRWDDQQKQNVIRQACAQAGGGHTPEQWQCVITAMKKSESYVKATDTCFAG